MLSTSRSCPPLIFISLLALSSLSASCDKPASAEGLPAEVTLEVRTVEAKDPTGVASAVCPPGSKLVGGGCKCNTASQFLFSSRPADDGYICGCIAKSLPAADEGVTAYAVCLDAANSVRNYVDVRSQTKTATAPDEARRQELEMLRAEQRRLAPQ